MVLKKNYFGWPILISISLSPLLPWLLVQPFQSRFATLYNILRSTGEICGLVGVTMFCLTLVLSMRLKVYEDFFGGMNRVYIAHHILGGFALIVLLIHPLALAGMVATYSLKSAALYLLPGSDWSINFGIAAFLLMMSLLILTFFMSIPYEIWRFSHKFLGLAFFIASIHGLYVSSDITTYPLVRNYMLCIYGIGLGSFTYKTLLGRFFIRKYEYRVAEVKQLQDNVMEIVLTPDKRHMAYLPGQFVFLSFKGEGISREVHPFSMSSTNTAEAIRFTVKGVGNYTSSLKNLQTGDIAYLEGSFGRFSYEKVKNKQQLWIAGGIGITPFLSMTRSLSSEYTIDLFYSVRTENEAVYLNDLQLIANKNNHFHVFPCYSKTQGRLTADIINKMSTDIMKKEIFICGPPLMMKSLRKQLIALHVPNNSIHTEEFALL